MKNDETTSDVILDVNLKGLMKWRRMAQQYREEMKAMQNTLEASPEYQEAFNNYTHYSMLSHEAEESIKDHALNTANFKHPAVKIIQKTTLSYDEDLARKYCLEGLPKAVKIDYKVFEQYARAVANTLPIPFVKISKVPTVQIATDLEKHYGDDVPEF